MEWIKAGGLRFDVRESPAGDVFGCRMAIYATDPKAERDRNKWVTELAFKLAG